MNWGMISTAVAIIFFIGMVFLSLRLVRKKEPAWAYKTDKIIGMETTAPPEVQLTYNGKAVKDVYRTTIIVFNQGQEPIRSHDIPADTVPITVSFQRGAILSEPEVKTQSNERIKVSVKKTGKNDVELGFAYLDHNDGTVIEVIHTAMAKISCEANIIGAKCMKFKGDFEDTFPRILSIRSAFGILLGILGVVYLVMFFNNKPIFGKGISELFLLFSYILSIFLAAILVNRVPLYFRSRKFSIWSRGVTKVRIPHYDTEGGIQAYCVQCKSRRVMKDPKVIQMKNGKPATQGVCPVCGTKIFRIGVP